MTTTPAMAELHRDQIIDLISPLSKNSADHDIEFAYRVIAALATLQAQPAAAGVSDAGAPFGMLRTTCPYCEQGFAFDRPEADASDELVDQHLDAILRAAGSALRHYTMQKSKDDMRSALRRAILALRPQAVPMTDDLANEFAREMVKGGRSVEWLVRKVESHHGITAPAGVEGQA